jgi:hypothetical protein
MQDLKTQVNENFQQLKTSGSRAVFIAAAAVWAACIVSGFAVMAKEQFTPVQATVPPADFPPGTQLALDVDRPTLLLFLHAHCPCSRATLSELQKLLTATHDKLEVTILFTIPPGTPPGWEQGELWNSARAIPGVRVVCDQNGAAARRFGVIGSGHALLYTPAGRLLFSGGITGSRGEEGDNAGEDAIADYVLRGHGDITHTPVFGCSLL